MHNIKIILIALLISINFCDLKAEINIIDSAIYKYQKIEAYKCNFSFNTAAYNILLDNYTLVISKNPDENVLGYNLYIFSDVRESENYYFLGNYWYFSSSKQFSRINKRENKMLRDIINKDIQINNDIETITYKNIIRILAWAKSNGDMQIRHEKLQESKNDSCYHIKIDVKSINKNYDIYLREDKFIPIKFEYSFIDSIGNNVKTSINYWNWEFNTFSGSDYFKDKERLYIGYINDQMQGRSVPNISIPIYKSDTCYNFLSKNNKTIILSCYKSDCSPSRENAYNMRFLIKDLEARTNLEFLTLFINDLETNVKIENFAQAYDIKGGILIGETELMNQLNFASFPQIYVISGGVIVYQHTGYLFDLQNILKMEINNIN